MNVSWLFIRASTAGTGGGTVEGGLQSRDGPVSCAFFRFSGFLRTPCCSLGEAILSSVTTAQDGGFVTKLLASLERSRLLIDI